MSHQPGLWSYSHFDSIISYAVSLLLRSYTRVATTDTPPRIPPGGLWSFLIKRVDSRQH